jgi:hypothetical protein
VHAGKGSPRLLRHAGGASGSSAAWWHSGRVVGLAGTLYYPVSAGLIPCNSGLGRSGNWAVLVLGQRWWAKGVEAIGLHGEEGGPVK